MLEYLDKMDDTSSVDMRWSFQVTYCHSCHSLSVIQVMVANVINEILFGYRYPYENCERLMNYVELLNKVESVSMHDFEIYTLPLSS